MGRRQHSTVCAIEFHNLIQNVLYDYIESIEQIDPTTKKYIFNIPAYDLYEELSMCIIRSNVLVVFPKSMQRVFTKRLFGVEPGHSLDEFRPELANVIFVQPRAIRVNPLIEY